MYENIPTTIHTRINSKLRISSIYRKYGNEYFEQWAWETYLWECNEAKKEYDSVNGINQVIEMHAIIFNKETKED